MKKDSDNEDMDWQTTADTGLHSAEWFGAIVRYLWFLGKRKFDSLYNQNEHRKNIIVGYSLGVMFLIALIAIGYYYTSKG